MSEEPAVLDETVVVAHPKQATQREQLREQQRDRKTKPQPRYNVILWDDPDHSYEYVIVMLRELFRKPVESGYQIAKEVDTSGRAILLTTTREHAELKRDQIHAFGKDQYIERCKGSMSATIEPIG
jgi:ATP-dependent Clp protease adaptor protein ClpS